MTTASTSFHRLVESLSKASVARRWEPYEDLDWDDPCFAIDRHDRRWVVPSWDPLGASPWYRAQPPPAQAAMGLHRAATYLRVGIEFEVVLTNGLLAYVGTLPPGHPSVRYAYHEIVEEAKHSMMFHEFIARSGFSPAPNSLLASSYTSSARLGSQMPALFFVCIIAAEELFDHVQRRALEDPDAHPLLVAINRIHIAEEARHLSFARASLKEIAPTLSTRELRRLRYEAAMVLEWAGARMFELPEEFATRWGVPREVVEEVRAGPVAVRVRREALARLVALCREIGIIDARMEPVWARMGLV